MSMNISTRRSARPDGAPFDAVVTRAVRVLRVRLEQSDPRGEMLDPDAICAGFARTLLAALSALARRASAEGPDGPAATPSRDSALTRLIEQVCARSAAAVAEAADRFVRDRSEIISSLLPGSDPGPLIAIEPTTGDPHQSGRRVAFLRFAGRADPLVYKPRSVTSAALFSRAVGWLNEQLPELRLADVDTLVRAGYGWAAFVRPAPCRTAEDAERFYYRQGALLALLHATNSIDVHADNLIAHRDQPILVDTEALLHPALPQPTLIAAGPAFVALETSVHRTLLLPTLMYGVEGTRDISGLGGRGDPMPYETAARTGGGVSNPPPANRPVLDGAPLEASEYLPHLLRGFGAAFTAIGANADAFIEVLESAGHVVTRLLARATRTYAELLDQALAPELLGNEAGTRELFESLASTPTFEGSSRLLEHEYRDLRDGDIPIFFARPGSRAIWTSRGVRIDEAFETAGLDAVRAKVRSMNDAERRRQEWVIDAAFATGTDPISHRTAAPVRFPDGGFGPTAPLDPQWAVEQAVEIARRIDELAYRDGRRVGWLSLEPLEDGHWSLLPAGGGLAHGYLGVALFLAQLGAITGRAGYLERAAEAISPLPTLLDSLAELPAHLESIGCGFAGTGGILYGLARLSTLLDSAELAERAVATIGLVARSAGQDGSYLEGRAGAIAALHAVHRELGAADAADLARKLGQQPLADHGHRGADGGHGAQDGWCRGAAAGRLDAASLDAWLDRLSVTAPVSDLSLCHGEFGILDALAILARRHARAREVLERRGAALPRAIEHGARLVGTPRAVLAPGLLHGLSGTGYGLLRTGFPDTAPSVLMMEPRPVRPPGVTAP